jgi:hypothetical protein
MNKDRFSTLTEHKANSVLEHSKKADLLLSLENYGLIKLFKNLNKNLRNSKINNLKN